MNRYQQEMKAYNAGVHGSCRFILDSWKVNRVPANQSPKSTIPTQRSPDNMKGPGMENSSKINIQTIEMESVNERERYGCKS